MGDIWLCDTRAVYGDRFPIQHWFILSIESYESFTAHPSYLVKYLHLETGMMNDKVFQAVTDLSGSKFYKKVA